MNYTNPQEYNEIYNYLNSKLVKNFPNKFAFISKTQKITFLELKLKVENLAINLKEMVLDQIIK